MVYLAVGFAVLAVLLIVGSLVKVLWFNKWLREHTVDDIRKATVYIDTGTRLVLEYGKLVFDGPEGSVYAFKYDKEPGEVFCPIDYPRKYVYGRRMVGLVKGELKASPLPTTSVPAPVLAATNGRVPHSASAVVRPGAAPLYVSKVVKARMGVQVVESITGGMLPAWLFPAIAALVFMVVIGGGLYYLNPGGIFSGPPVTVVPTPVEGGPLP